MSTFVLRVTGIQQIDKVLVGLPLQLNHRVLQAAHADAAKPLVEAEQLGAPEGPTGNLIDSIGIIKTPFARAGQLGEISVGPRRGKYKGYAAHLVEFGTTRRALRGTGKYKAGTNRGTMPSRPFVVPAWARTQNAVRNGIKLSIAKKLVTFMRSTLRK
jgi:hypothetical protein